MMTGLAGEICEIFANVPVPEGWRQMQGQSLAVGDYPYLAINRPDLVTGNRITLPDYRGVVIQQQKNKDEYEKGADPKNTPPYFLTKFIIKVT